MKTPVRLFLSLSLAFCLASCSQPYSDSRSDTQRSFASYTQSWRDSVNAAQQEPSKRSRLLEQGVDAVKSRIVDSLNLSFNDWEVRVLDKNSDASSPGTLIVNFGMDIDGAEPSEKNRYSSIVLSSRIHSGHTLHEPIKNLKVGDIVHIDGRFQTLQNTINVDSYNKLRRSQNVLDNPEFRVGIEGLRNSN